MLDLLGQLLSMAIRDEIFEVDFRDLDDIYWHEIPLHKVGMELKVKRKRLDLAIFREPERTDNGYGTSETTPLKAATWARYLKDLGIVAGLERNLTQYFFRRTLINTLNSMFPFSRGSYPIWLHFYFVAYIV